MKIFILSILLLCSLVLITSCSNKCDIESIQVSELLSTVAKEHSIDYCRLLKRAIDGDVGSIREISLLEFNDAVGYDHGAVLVDLVLRIGEGKYIEAISQFNDAEKNLIESYFDVGISYGNNSELTNKEFEDSFPKLYAFLKQ